LGRTDARGPKPPADPPLKRPLTRMLLDCNDFPQQGERAADESAARNKVMDRLSGKLLARFNRSIAASSFAAPHTLPAEAKHCLRDSATKALQARHVRKIARLHYVPIGLISGRA